MGEGALYSLQAITIYSTGESIIDLISPFQESFKNLFQWFSDDTMKCNSF